MADSSSRPFRRQVFFISGFDPRGVLFLHKNCVTETEKWAKTTGYDVKTGARKNVSKLVRRWPITATLPTGTSETSFDFLQWDDIIREHWDKRNWLVYLQSIAGLWRLLLDGVYTRTIRDSWPIAIVMSAPAMTAILHGLGVLLPLLGLLGLYFFPGVIGKVLALVLIGAGAYAFWWIRKNMDRYKPEWNGRIGLFANKMVQSRDFVPGLDERLNQMVDHIVASIDEGKPDEALIVGHSFGTSIASIVTSRVLERRPEWGAKDSPLGLVTLGETQCLLAFRNKPNWYHEELSRFAKFPDFNWLDFSSPPDGACFAMINVLDFLPNPPKAMPRQLNAQFHKIFSEDHMNEARYHRMLMHFFYMQASDNPDLDSDLYDFVLLISGTQKARERYGKRPSGKPFFRKER
ncbi:alpha/beta hydrolase [Rhizobium sp. KVB221]|uniref:Alpha/beta hydrolase n=1 Tax=Rhizobium setariae TaxID=2801340 RepID=A0A937CNY1_9HYPH|nr:alpha/beta hydrolase [Rhizobium setariae]MBL0372534.1 alpha/beta hydrolase [Rhizobium setariae]